LIFPNYARGNNIADESRSKTAIYLRGEHSRGDEDALAYDEASRMVIPVAEIARRTALNPATPQKPKRSFRADLTKNPTVVRSLLGLAEVTQGRVGQGSYRPLRAISRRVENG